MRTPEDALAAVPVILDFEPRESLVVMTFGGTDTFHARIDLPPPAAESALDQVLDQVVAPALTHRVTGVVIVVYSADQEWAAVVDRAATAAFTAVGVDVHATVRADGHHWWAPGWPGHAHRSTQTPKRGTPYDSSSHRFRAQSVLRGHVVHGSRHELAAMLQAIPAAVATVRSARRGAATVGATEVGDLVRTGVAAGRLADEELAVLLLSLRRPAGRDAAWAELDRSSAEAHLRFWVDVVQRAPADLVLDPAAVLALTAWLAGHGALAWCAIDRCCALRPDHSLVRIVAEMLTAATPPSVWPRLKPDPPRRSAPLRLVGGATGSRHG